MKRKRMKFVWVHFAGPIKAWHTPPHHSFGSPMHELSKLVQHSNYFKTMINLQMTSGCNPPQNQHHQYSSNMFAHRPTI